MIRLQIRSTLFPYTTLFRSETEGADRYLELGPGGALATAVRDIVESGPSAAARADRKSTRLNSSHANISYAVFCLKKKNEIECMNEQYVTSSTKKYTPP